MSEWFTDEAIARAIERARGRRLRLFHGPPAAMLARLEQARHEDARAWAAADIAQAVRWGRQVVPGLGLSRGASIKFKASDGVGFWPVTIYGPDALSLSWAVDTCYCRVPGRRPPCSKCGQRVSRGGVDPESVAGVWIHPDVRGQYREVAGLVGRVVEIRHRNGGALVDFAGWSGRRDLPGVGGFGWAELVPAIVDPARAEGVAIAGRKVRRATELSQAGDPRGVRELVDQALKPARRRRRPRADVHEAAPGEPRAVSMFELDAVDLAIWERSVDLDEVREVRQLTGAEKGLVAYYRDLPECSAVNLDPGDLRLPPEPGDLGRVPGPHPQARCFLRPSAELAAAMEGRPDRDGDVFAPGAVRTALRDVEGRAVAHKYSKPRNPGPIWGPSPLQAVSDELERSDVIRKLTASSVLMSVPGSLRHVAEECRKAETRAVDAAKLAGVPCADCPYPKACLASSPPRCIGPDVMAAREDDFLAQLKAPAKIRDGCPEPDMCRNSGGCRGFPGCEDDDPACPF